MVAGLTDHRWTMRGLLSQPIPLPHWVDPKLWTAVQKASDVLASHDLATVPWGAKPDGSIGEDHGPETHLLPIILQVAQGVREKIMIFGNDYNTPDGTNVRDYVHPFDLADAH